MRRCSGFCMNCRRERGYCQQKTCTVASGARVNMSSALLGAVSWAMLSQASMARSGATPGPIDRSGVAMP